MRTELMLELDEQESEEVMIGTLTLEELMDTAHTGDANENPYVSELTCDCHHWDFWNDRSGRPYRTDDER